MSYTCSMNTNCSGCATSVGFTVGDRAAYTCGIVSKGTGCGVWQATGTSKCIVEGFPLSFNVQHCHCFDHKHTYDTTYNGDQAHQESRPINYAVKIWKRVLPS